MINMDCGVCKANKKLKKATHYTVYKTPISKGVTYMCFKHFKEYGINKKGYFVKLTNT